MFEFSKILYAILSGVAILLIGEFILRSFIEPILKQKAIINGIAYYLEYYSNVLSNPGKVKEELTKEASSDFRKLGINIIVKTSAIPQYELAQKYFKCLSKEDIIKISRAHIGISNYLLEKNKDEIRERVDIIKKSINIKNSQ